LIVFVVFSWLAIFGSTAALAFAGVLAGTTVVAGFAAAFAFAGVLAFAVVSLALLIVGADAGAGAGVRLAGLSDICSAQRREWAASDNAGNRCTREESFGFVTYHIFLSIFCFVLLRRASRGILENRRSMRVRLRTRDFIPASLD
jgi:hypothetical protein